MKKFFISTVILSLMVLAGCSEVKTIEERIHELEAALNDNNYWSFMECFSSDAENYANYTIGDFTGLTGAGTVSWEFGNISVSGDSATCAAIKTIGGADVPVMEEFDMVSEDGNTLILQWREEGSAIMNIKQK